MIRVLQGVALYEPLQGTSLPFRDTLKRPSALDVRERLCFRVVFSSGLPVWTITEPGVICSFSPKLSLYPIYHPVADSRSRECRHGWARMFSVQLDKGRAACLAEVFPVFPSACGKGGCCGLDICFKGGCGLFCRQHPWPFEYYNQIAQAFLDYPPRNFLALAYHTSPAPSTVRGKRRFGVDANRHSLW